MNNKDIQISKFITPGDFAAVIVIAIGIITAMYFEEIAIRMIGVSIAILGAVALFMLISQRLSEVIERPMPKSSSPQPEFKVTTTQDAAAKRQTVEDFAQSFGGDDDFPITKATLPKIELPEATSAKNQESSGTYNDGFSGMRIVGKVKPSYSDSSTQQNSNKSQTEMPKRLDILSNKQNANVTETRKNVENIESIQNPIASVLITNQETQIENTDTLIVQENVIEKMNQFETKDASNENASNEIYTQTEIHFNNTEPIENIEHQKNEEVRYKGKIIDLPVNVFMETDQLIGDEPRKEFEYFMTRILTIIRSSTDTRTALFFLFNAQTNELVLESYVTSLPLILKSKLKYTLDNDIVSQIVANSKPQILSQINPASELDLIPYYKSPASTGSLIGVPVFWGEGVIGVLIADSESTNAYDSATVAFLGHFTKIVGAIVKSYTHKYNLLQSSKALDAINTFYSISSNYNESINLPEIISDTLKNLFPNSNVGLCGFDSQSDSWQIKSYKGSGKDITGMHINIEDSLIGKSIYECKTYHIKNSDKFDHIRIYPQENPLEFEFVSVPIKSSTQIFGAIFIESFTNDSFSEFDISVVELIGNHSGINIEKQYLMDSLNSSAIYEPNSGLLNPNALYSRIEEELFRAFDFKSSVCLCLLRFDKYSLLDPIKFPQRYEYAVNSILPRIHQFLKPYDLFGRVDDDTYGILFIGKDANQARLTAERIRADVAKTIVEHTGNQFSITLSMGLISPKSNYDINLLVKDAFTGLEKAYETGNQVQVLT